MDEHRKWDSTEDELEDTEALLNSGAVPVEEKFSLDDIMREFGGEALTGTTEPEEGTAEEEASVSEQAPAQEVDLGDTAEFIGQQVADMVGESGEQSGAQAQESALDGFRRLWEESRRKSADEKLRREQQKKEKNAAKALEEAARVAAEEQAREQEALREAQEREEEEKVVEFNTPKMKPIRDSFGQFHDKLTDFADNMYSDAGTAEDDQTRAYVSGTDEEEPVEEKKSWRERKPRKQYAQAADLPAEELARRYRLGLKSMKTRLMGLLGITLVTVLLSVVEELGAPIPTAILDMRALGAILTWLLALGGALCLDVVWLGLTAPFRGRMGLHTLSAVAVLTTLVDGLYYTLVGREGGLPFAGMALLSLLGAGWGAYQRKKALYISCKTAAGAAEPQRVTLDEDKWDGISAFTKETGTSEGFGSQIQGMDGAERIYRIWVPVVALVAVISAVVSSVGHGQLNLLTWCLSTSFVAAAPLSSLLAFGMPYLRLTKRLDRSGAVLAGWDGVESMMGKANILLKDEDLFPDGSIHVRSIKHFKGVSLEKLTGCTASMLRTAGTGLYHIFDDELRRQGGFYRRVDDLQCYEAGGLTADIRGDQVLVGTQGFLTVMNCKLEDGMKIRRAVYCVINKKLEGIFSLEYEMDHYAKESIQALVKGGVQPVLVTRDFNVIPSMLETKFDLPVEQMEYPPIERRRELSEPNQEHNPTLGALLTRSGMGPYSDALIGGRRLYRVVRINAILSVLAALIGVALAFYLTWSAAFASLTPLTMTVFLLLWLMPVLAVSGVVDKF